MFTRHTLQIQTTLREKLRQRGKHQHTYRNRGKCQDQLNTLRLLKLRQQGIRQYKYRKLRSRH